MAGKKLNKKKLEQKAWSIFSKFIRLRDCDKSGGCNCCTCGKYIYFGSDMHAWHWISRQYQSTKFHEKNVHWQCVGCNIFGKGKPELHELFIVENHGKKTRDELLELVRDEKSNPHKYKTTEEYYTGIIEKYTEKIGKLTNN